ncbi:MAG: ABC transporter permease [Defluviitaleaceae bacterium]|nr:ABC transporter permease [Defluviitaleaceae bacterium]
MKFEKLTAKLAYSQLKINRRRSLWTLFGVVLSTAMLTAVYGFVTSGIAAVVSFRDGDDAFIETYSEILIGVGAVLSGIIAATAVIVMSNAFRISAAERTRQFGILKSVGATRQQIRQTVMYEALLLSAVGIPVGVVAGLLVQFLGLQIAEFFLAGVNQLLGDNPIIIPFVVAWQAILVAIVAAFATIMLSAWLPAWKGAKIPAIAAIRNADEVKLKARKMCSGWFDKTVGKIFGFEGQLAAKSVKRNKRNLRATVVSITVSIVLFIAATSVGGQMQRAINLRFIDSDINVAGIFFSSALTDPETGERQSLMIDSALSEEITSRLREFPNTTVVGFGREIDDFWAIIPAEYLTAAAQNHFPQDEDGDFAMQVTLITVDSATYAELCQLAGVPLGSNILVNQFRGYDWENNRLVEFTPHIWNGQTLINLREPGEFYELPLHGELRNLPAELLEIAGNQFVVIVPELVVRDYTWLAATEDSWGFGGYMHALFSETFTPKIENWVEQGFHADFNVIDFATNAANERSLVQLIMVFVYGFVAMLTLIGLTNVISTISTNVRSRFREFAALQSVGMTHEGIGRMLNLESVLCSAKSLILGLPIGVGVSFFTHSTMERSFAFEYAVPWLAILQCVAAVFLITWITMRYSATQLRGHSIVEEVR